jgi:hypothetical protein
VDPVPEILAETLSSADETVDAIESRIPFGPSSMAERSERETERGNGKG